MKIICWRTIPTIICLVALAITTFAYADILAGQDNKADIQLGIYASDSDGNQDFVRQYDGRRFDLWGIEELNLYGYDGDNQYWIKASDLIAGNENLSLNITGRNTYGLSLSTEAMTHRQGKVPAINPYLAPFGMSQVINGVPTGDAFLDLSPTDTYRLNRRVNDFKVNLTPDSLGWLRFTAGSWQEIERGTQQLLFRSRATTPGIIRSSTKASAAVSIDRTSTENTLGADLSVGKNSVINYEYANTTFTDNGGNPAETLSAVFPLNAMTKINSKTNTNILKANSRISKQLFFTGVHINRNRKNTVAIVPTADTSTDYVDAGTFLAHTVKTDTTNLAMTYHATDALSLIGRWKEFTQRDRIPTIFLVDEIDPLHKPLGRNIRSWELNGSFTGIRHAYINGGFERRDETLLTDKEIEPPHTAFQTSSDTWNVGFRFNPNPRLSLSAKWDDRSNREGRALYPGDPTDRERLNINATYLIGDNFSLYGDYSDSDEKNREIRVDFNDPALDAIIDAPTDEEVIDDIANKRILGAGQGYRNKMATWGVGAWCGLTPKLSMNVHAGRVKTSAVALLVLEIDPGPNPLMAADFAPFSATSDQWAVGLDYAITPKWRTHGRYQNTSSRGQTILSIIPSDPALSQGWQPVKLRENTWTLGTDYQVNKSERVILNFSVSDWRDVIDAANDGRFTIWNLSWAFAY